jgi:hypothetical protein
MSHKITTTYKLGPISSESSGSPFNLLIRMPGWFPDGVDDGRGQCQRLFPEEMVGLSGGSPLPLPVPFQPDYHTWCGGDSDRWIHGVSIPDLPNPTTDQTEAPLTTLVRDLAVKVRRYNASLYRLRRLHYHQKYSACAGYKLPPRNPYGDPTSVPSPTADPDGFKIMISDAETDWRNVNDDLNCFLDKDTGIQRQGYGLALIAADMVEVNGYVISIRVVANPVFLKEAGGSSSHVSISSAFSSS